jgi:membrane protein YfhO
MKLRLKLGMSGNHSRTGAAGEWFGPGRFAAILGLLIVAAYPDVVFGGNTFYFRDFGFFGYPLAHYHRQSFWEGQIPLWNPLNNCGLPFLAQWNTLVLYPGSLLYLLFPPSWSLGIFCLLHLLLAGVGMYLLACRWMACRLGASVAGMAFALNGVSLNCLMWPNNMAALAWMPLVILSVERAWRGGGRHLVGAVALGSMQMLTGAPEIILFTWVIVAALAVFGIVRGQQSRATLMWRVGVILLLVAALTAAQLLPFFELLHHSQRSLLFADASWSMPGTGWANFLVPLFRTFLSRQGVYYQNDQYWTASYYPGIAVFALACVGVACVKTWRVRVLAALVLLGAVLAMGDNGFAYGLLRGVVPQLGVMRYPIKFVILAVFGLPLLAGFGVRYLENTVRTSRSRCWRITAICHGTFLLLIGLILWFAHRYPLPNEDWTATLQSGLSRSLFLTLILGAICFRSGLSERPRLFAGVAFLTMIGLDVLTHMPRQNPTVTRAALEPEIPTLQKLDPLPRHGQSRAMLTAEADVRLRHGGLSSGMNDYLASRQGLFSNCNLLEGIPKINGFYSLYLREAQDIWALVYQKTNTPAPRLYDFMSVSQMTAPGEVFEWRHRPTALPFATFGQQPRFANAASTLSSLVSQEFRPQNEAYLPEEVRTLVHLTEAGVGKVEESRFDAQRAELRVSAETPGLLVIAQNYDSPWKASIDGAAVPIWRANHAFQAVAVPPGKHVIRLQYRDWSFVWGTAVSLAALAGCAFANALSARRRSKKA